MKRLTLIILGVLLCTPLYSDMNTYVIGSGVPVSGGCTENCADYLICQNFEGTGYDNSEAWTENGTVDEDYTTTILRGSQSCQITTTGYISPTDAFTGQSTLYMHWLYRKASNPDSEARLFAIRSSAGYMAYGHLQPDGTIKLTVGNGTPAYTSELSNDTTYHIWVVYTAGTAGNGSVSLYAGTGLTRPASPLATANNTGGTSVGDAIVVVFDSGGVTTTVDQILVDGSSFSEVCE